MPATIHNWQQLSTRKVAEARVFDLHARRMRSPDGSYEDDFFVIEARDWCNIIALTEKQEVVMVEQFRHGRQETGLELPGGILDPGDTEPKTAALRELEEETGYLVSEAITLGQVDPNPAIQTNQCHFFFAENARRDGTVNLDPAEDIGVHLVPLKEVPELIAEGRISHALMVCAFFRLMLRPELLKESVL